ncbi:MAG TPA: (d)CMP kinase [Gemmatimonadales bacterium]|nr:(d)CMP kinase [Gemmatimonadales bacterium]
MSGIVIAIDGPSASGKSSTARAVAEALGFSHLDSGSLYRGVTLVAIRELEHHASGTDPLEVGAEKILRAAEDRGLMLLPDGAGYAAYLEGEPVDDAIRSAEVTRHVSAVSAVPVIREWVNSYLRQLVRAGQNVVVDGRDIGTVVFPDADLKVFLTASPKTRAGRRLSQRGQRVDQEEIDREAVLLEGRDRADSTRSVAPLRRAGDALELDTTSLSFGDAVSWILERARAAFGR